MYCALHNWIASPNGKHNRKGKEMNKVISLLTILTLTSPAFATDYKTDSYEKYGYAAGASAIPSTELKGGLRGSHVAATHHRENAYYPGYMASQPKNDK